MSRRLSISFALVVLGFAPWTARDARAQERPTPLNLSAAVVENAVAAPAVAVPEQFAYPIAPPQKRIDPMMSSLYASTALMQGLDVHSTLKALDAGAVEGNPLMTGVTKNKAAFIAMKAGLAAGTIFAAHKASKKNRAAAIISLGALNSVYARVVNHNDKVASGR